MIFSFPASNRARPVPPNLSHREIQRGRLSIVGAFARTRIRLPSRADAGPCLGFRHAHRSSTF
jgi:hypothetical protein